ncbi:MAG TPA: tetratricopeptide repeat protein [Thermoanaerobaculia bacterium]|nr:tetratricopeptide repeat protein [Thermoanaerobaculia bacterium]
MNLERLEITPFAVICGELLRERRTGHLTIVRQPQRTVLYWSQGDLVLIAPDAPEQSLGDFLVRKGVLPREKVLAMFSEPTDVVAKFHESGVGDLSSRQTVLREWMAAQFLPLFSLDEGTAVFTESEPLPPEKRVFLQSTAAFLLGGIRSITNGLVLRRSLGDLKRMIRVSRDGRFDFETVPLTAAEREIAESLTQPTTIESFLRQFTSDSLTAARVVIGMMALGIYVVADEKSQHEPPEDMAQMQRDLELLAAIGSSDPRSLRAVALSRQMDAMDHYQFLGIARAASRAEVIATADQMKKLYDINTYPPVVRDSIQAINQRIDEAVNVLKEATSRAAYDRLLAQPGARGRDATIQQKMTQKMIAEQNYQKAKELSVAGDYYGAIVLLQQAVEFAPERADAWYLLGACQERNPRWRRDAVESYQKALSVDPNFVDVLISLGDLYKAEGLTSRAQTCFEDALKIEPENPQAKSRLAALKKK